MDGYFLVSLKNMLTEIGEEKTNKILSDFSCPMNRELEHFLKNSAIQFVKQNTAPTYLIFASYKDNPVLAAYFTLTTKQINVKMSSIGSTLARKLKKFAEPNKELKSYSMPAPLIAQLGKNFTSGYNNLITGDELITLALDKIKEGQLIFGGKVVYIECENNDKLISFYESHGFLKFDTRKKPKSEQIYGDANYYVQMLKYIKG